MKRMIAFISSICICTSLVGCANNNSSINSFDEAKAITMAIKDHPGFPSNPSETITKKQGTGGPPGTTKDVKFTTKVEKTEKSTYVVTLTKDWGFSFNDEYVKSYWKYKVTPKSVTLVDSIDKEQLPNMMK